MSEINAFNSEQTEACFVEFLEKQPKFTDNENYRAKLKFRDYLIEEGLTKEEVAELIGNIPFVIRSEHANTTVLDIFIRHFARQIVHTAKKYEEDFGKGVFRDIISKGVIVIDSINILKFDGSQQ